MKIHFIISLIAVLPFFLSFYSDDHGSELKDTENDKCIIAVSSTGQSIDSIINHNFGRCDYLLFYDCEKEKLTVFENPGAGMQRRAGQTATEFVISQRATHLVTGNIGDKLEIHFKNAGIKVVTDFNGTKTVKEAINFVRSDL